MFGVVGLSLLAGTRSTFAQPAALDVMTFGLGGSEAAHALIADHSDTVKGTLGEPARRLLALETPKWNSGSVSFVMKIDPENQNYFTARFSGDEVNENRLTLYADGKQVGWRHLGEVDQLDFGTVAPAYPGRFYYNTSPLPLAITRGKTKMKFEIRSSGLIWPYGTNFDQYQKLMTKPSRGIYRVYTHTDGCFVPPSDEMQGAAPSDLPVRKSPGPEVLEQIKARVNAEIEARLDSKQAISQMQMQLLAKAYDMKWTQAYQNPKAIQQIIKGLDALFDGYRRNPHLAEAEPSTWNPDWFGLGICGEVIALRQVQLNPCFDGQIDDGAGGKITRRAGLTEMLVACRDWHRQHRRQYTNQTMLNDLNGIYFANRGVEVLDPSKALSEPEARRYLYESVGLEPWRDSDPGGNRWNVGPNYMQLTEKGLSKELGYVGTYGEVIDLVAAIYDGTRPAPSQPGDEKIRTQLVKVAMARAAMRFPAIDSDGNRVMQLEQIIGWRDLHYPGEMAYGQRPTRDASALQAAAYTLDPRLVGYAQQMIADNQFFASEVHAMEDRAQPLRTTIGRLETPDQYELMMSQPQSSDRLPMSADQKDFVFTDETDGVVAFKHGNEILYASLYWRARFGINNLARVHYITPRFDRIAVVSESTIFQSSGKEFTWPNWTNYGFGNGGFKYPVDLESAYTGQKVPIAKFPDGLSPIPGHESPYNGRGDFYTLRYGRFVIGLNMTHDKTFELKIPDNAKSAAELGSHSKDLVAGATMKVRPLSTVILEINSVQ
jgi:hypothetical protein